MRRVLVLLCVLLTCVLFAWIFWRGMVPQLPNITAAPVIVKQPAVIESRTFDPDAPPAEMPPLSTGELAVCDSNFGSNATVSGQSRYTDSTHATVTITKIQVTLQLTVTMWTPSGATQHVIDHEEGHREISEYYYQIADKIAAQIAARYIGKRLAVTGADLPNAINLMLQQTGKEIDEEYGKELNPEQAQLRYDEITDHSRNDVDYKSAVAQAIKETADAPAETPSAPESDH